MKYTIDSGVFERYPGFMRVVLVADGIDNSREDPALAALLEQCHDEVRERLDDNFKELPQLAAWAEAFRSMGINPNKYPPSVVNLIKRVRSGKNLPYVNSLVAVFNCISLRHLCPCGGDDLAPVTGDLRLCFAEGTERYVPLGRPEVVEHPPAGEIIYMDTGTQDVFCRAWCWKNGDVSKLSPETVRAAINIDIMAPLGRAEAEAAASEMAALLGQYTGARTQIHFLDAGNPGFVM